MIILFIILIIFYLNFNKKMVEHYDNNENKNDILKKLYIWTNIENNIINIEYNNKTIVNPGKYGLNIVIINTKMKIKNVLYIDTGTQFYENDIFIEFKIKY